MKTNSEQHKSNVFQCVEISLLASNQNQTTQSLAHDTQYEMTKKKETLKNYIKYWKKMITSSQEKKFGTKSK